MLKAIGTELKESLSDDTSSITGPITGLALMFGIVSVGAFGHHVYRTFNPLESNLEQIQQEKNKRDRDCLARVTFTFSPPSIKFGCPK